MQALPTLHCAGLSQLVAFLVVELETHPRRATTVTGGHPVSIKLLAGVGRIKYNKVYQMATYFGYGTMIPIRMFINSYGNWFEALLRHPYSMLLTPL